MKHHVLLVMGVISFCILIAFRAYLIPMTHDEAGTFLNYRDINVWSCFYDSKCWGNANNHWLNTLLMQWSVWLFGDEPWAIRLPNVVAGTLYIVCAGLICARYIKNSYLQLAGLVIMCGHVYLLDFFSLARGYGLMTAGVLWAIYGMLYYIASPHRKWLIFSITILIVSVLANFTALLPWAAMGACWLAWLLNSKRSDLLVKHGMYWFGSAVVLFLLLRFPISTLSKSGEFEWGASSPWTMGINLLENLLYGVRYFGEDTYRYALYLTLLFVFLSLFRAFVSPQPERRQPVLFMGSFLIMNVLVICLVQVITGAQAPIGRKSIYLIPVVFGLLAISLGLLKNIGTMSFVGIIVTLAFIGHLIFTLPMKSCREWFYDAYYPELFSEIIPAGPDSDSVRLGSTWIFNPSLVFYQNTKQLPLAGLEYQKPLVIDSTMDFYYIEPTDTTGMIGNGFEIEKRIGPFFLFKRSK